MSEDRTIRVRLTANVEQYRQAMAQAGRDAATFGKNISGHGKATRKEMQDVGKAALIMSGGIAVGLGLSVKAAVDWESAWAGVSKTVNGTAAEMADLEQGLRNLASELPATHGEIAAVAEAAGALGIQRSAIEGFTHTMIDLGETTDLTADQAANSLARISNIMGTSSSDIERMGSTLVALGNNGASTESEILELSTRLAAAGRIAGLTEADIFSFASTLSSVGVEAEAGGTAMSKVFTSVRDAVLDGGDALQTFASTAGMSTAAFSASFREDAAGAITQFIEGLGRLNRAGRSTSGVFEDLELTDQRLMRALLSTSSAGELLADTIDMGREAWEKNNALQLEADKRYDTTAAKLEVLRNNVVDLGIDIGDHLLPMLAGAAEGASTMAQGFGSLDGAAGTAVTAIGGLSAAGLGLIGVVGTFGPKIKDFKKGLIDMEGFGAKLGNNLGKATMALGAVGVGVGVLSYVLGQSEQRRQKAIDLSKEYAAAIREETGALDENIDAVTARKLGEFGGATALREAGADFDLLIDGIQGSGAALDMLSDDFNAAAKAGGTSAALFAGNLEDAGLAGTALGDELTRLKGEMSAEEFDDFLGILGALGIGYKDGATLARNLDTAQAGVKGSAEGASVQVGNLGDSVKVTNEQLAETEDAGKRFKEGIEQALQPLDQRAALDQFNSALNDLAAHFADAEAEVGDAQERMGDRQRDLADLLATPADQRGEGFDRRVQDARDAIVDAQADIDEAYAGTTRILEGNSQAAIDNRDRLTDLAEKGTTAIEQAAADQSLSIEDLEAMRDGLIAQMELEATRLGLNTDEVGFYTDALNRIPLGELATSVRLDVETALANAERLAGALEGLVGLGMSFSVNALEVDKALIRNAGLPEHGDGGTVAGPRGSRQLVVAHGGETVLPTHKMSVSDAMAGMGSSAGGSSDVYLGGVTLMYPKAEDPSVGIPRAIRKARAMA